MLPASREGMPGQEDTCLRPHSPELVPPLADQGKVVLMAGVLNHFYKNQPVAQPLPSPSFLSLGGTAL